MVNLTRFPTEVIDIILHFLNAYEIVNLYLSGSSVLISKILTQKYSAELVMSEWQDMKIVLKNQQSKMFQRDPKYMDKAHNKLASINGKWKYMKSGKEVLSAIGPICTLRIPRLVFQLPRLTAFILEMPQMVLLGYFNINADLLRCLPPSLTRLELNGQIDLRLDEEGYTFFDFGAQLPELEILKLKRYHNKLVFISPTKFGWAQLASVLPSTLKSLGISSVLETSMLETRGKPLATLRQLSSFDHFGWGPQIESSNFDLSNFSPQILTHLSIPRFKDLSSLPHFQCLVSLSVQTLNPTQVSALPTSLTSLSISAISGATQDATKLDTHWSRFIPKLPSTLRSLSLSYLTFSDVSFHPQDTLTPPYTRRTKLDEIQGYQNQIFPKSLTSLKMDFNGAMEAIPVALIDAADPCCISQILPASMLDFEFKKPMLSGNLCYQLPWKFRTYGKSFKHFGGDFWTKLKPIATSLNLDITSSASVQLPLLPSHLTSLSFKAIVPFEEDTWTHLKNLTYLSVCNGWGVPEYLLYSPTFPKNLTTLRIYLLTVDGTSWKYISEKAHLPQYQSFISAFSKVNKRSYRSAVLFETKIRTCKIEIDNYDYTDEMRVLPTAATSQGKIRLSQYFMDSLDIPSGLTALNVKGHEISSKFLSALPSTLESVTNATLKLTSGELDDLAARYFHQWSKIEIPGSFSRAMQSEFPILKNPKILVSVPLAGRTISKWLHTKVEKLTLKGIEILGVDDIFTTCTLESLVEWKLDSLPVLKSCDIFKGAPNLQKMSCRLSMDSISFLPRNLTELDIPSIIEQVHSKNTSPNWPSTITTLRVQDYPNFLAHLTPTSMLHLQTLIIGTNVSVQDEIIAHIPRCVTELRIKSSSPLTTSCIQHLPMNLKLLKIAGGHLESERILLEQKEWRNSQNKQVE